MTRHKLSFGIAEKIQFDIAEITVDKGVELDMEMVIEYHNWIEKMLPDPCFVLINKKKPFTYTFEALRKIGTIRKIKAAAFFAPSGFAYQTTEMLAKLPRELDWNYKIFDSRDMALLWLINQKKNH